MASGADSASDSGSETELVTYIDDRGYLVSEVPHSGKEKDGMRVLHNGDRVIRCTIPAADRYKGSYAHNHIITYCEETGKVESRTFARSDYNERMALLYVSQLTCAFSVMLPVFFVAPLVMVINLAAFEQPYADQVKLVFSYQNEWGSLGFSVYLLYVFAMALAFLITHAVFASGWMDPSVVLHCQLKPPRHI